MPGERKATLWTRSFVLIIVINFLVFMNHIMVLTTFPIFLQDVLGQDESVAGIAALLFSIIAILLRPFVGWLLNNGRRKSVLMIGLTWMFLMPPATAPSRCLPTAENISRPARCGTSPLR